MAQKIKEIYAKLFFVLINMTKTLFAMGHGTCRFEPTCSLYAYTALQQLSLHKAILVIIKRVLRCNPFTKGGYDPVPEKIKGVKRGE
jgi:uncharacterized protein